MLLLIRFKVNEELSSGFQAIKEKIGTVETEADIKFKGKMLLGLK